LSLSDAGGIGATGKKRWIMRVVRKLREWWRALWGPDFYWPAEVDSHRWENKTEILRRLSTRSS
jgi:hypothetical protein